MPSLIMHGALHEFLTRDHERLDALFTRCRDAAPDIPLDAYEEFRQGLLWHIGVEEKILFPQLRKRHGVTELEQQLHRDHAALAVLLVPPPSLEVFDQIAAILVPHNELEEVPGGMYELVERDADLEAMMKQIAAMPPVPLVPNVDSAFVRQAIDQLVRIAQEGRG